MKFGKEFIAKNKNKYSDYLYKEWFGMLYRCYYETCNAYYKYGAKGIKVEEEWFLFDNFAEWSLKNGFSDEFSPTGRHKYTIDRIDSDKNYGSNNCRWATYAEQNSHLKMLSTNTSGYKGVSWSKGQHKWLVNISINNKSHRIGAYNTQREAIERRNLFIKENNLMNEIIEYEGEKFIYHEITKELEKVICN